MMKTRIKSKIKTNLLRAQNDKIPSILNQDQEKHFLKKPFREKEEPEGDPSLSP